MSQTSTEPFLKAKSIHNGNVISLEAHLQDTAQAARLIFGLNQRVGRNFLKSFKLTQEESAVFQLNLEIACLFHDIGKANEGFLKAIEGKKNSQLVRHEHLSALFMQLPEIQSWLKQNEKLLQPLILAAVLSHHLKARGIGDIGARPEGCLYDQSALFFNNSQISAILNQIKDTAQLGPPPPLGKYKYFAHHMPVWTNCIDELERDSKKLKRLIQNSESAIGQSNKRLLAALKTALIVSDTVASGTVREGYSTKEWLRENLHLKAITKEELFNKIIEPCTKRIERRTGRPYQPEPFQLSVARMGTKCLLQAGCGTGKTLAAYYWAAQQLEQGEFGRVIFLYPTRGTATEGFKDYTAWAPEEEAMLLHGQSQYVLTSMLENPPESAKGKLYINETNERLFALANYQRRFFSATVDQFLSFLQHNYTSMCLSVILTDSVIILDEIHSYDRQLFATALEYLRSMDIPTLCMTASLKQKQIKELADNGVEISSNSAQAGELQNLLASEKRPRYLVNWTANKDQALEICKEAIKDNKKVLWVVNTVNRCQQIATLLNELNSNQVICYHSRFKLCDREQQHNKCISTFSPDSHSTAVVAVTTQVCEMSLDLDADVLISELAPISSLIQRMGRANRHSQNRPPSFTAPVIIYKPGDDDTLAIKPYQKAEMDDAEEFVNWLADESTIVSQQILAEGMEKFTTDERATEPSSRLFESGYFATPGFLREIDEFTVPAVLSEDLHEAQYLIENKQGIEKLLVPVPRYVVLKETPNWLPKYFFVTASNQYTKDIGFFSNTPEVK